MDQKSGRFPLLIDPLETNGIRTQLKTIKIGSNPREWPRVDSLFFFFFFAVVVLISRSFSLSLSRAPLLLIPPFTAREDSDNESN